MGSHSKIEWTDHTFNPWIGCQKVSAGCDHCYAERMGKRFGVKWGLDGERRLTKTWRDPIRWHNRIQKQLDKVPPLFDESPPLRPHVFCGSLCDVFEADHVLDEWRDKLWELVEQTTNLCWLLLTKRPQNVLHSVPAAWHEAWPDHVWVGTTVENQPMAERRLPYLCAIPAPVLFISGEPLLGPISLTNVRFSPWTTMNVLEGTGISTRPGGQSVPNAFCRAVGWVIAGGESGPGARPMHPDWARRIREDCSRTEVPFFFKQWGEYVENKSLDRLADVFVGSDGRSYSPQMRDAMLPEDVTPMVRVGKKKAGNRLDGFRHLERPETIR